MLKGRSRKRMMKKEENDDIYKGEEKKT